MIARRQIVLASCAVALSLSPVALAQQPARPARVGFLKFLPRDNEVELGPFRQGMRELGQVEGKTYVLEIRSADNNAERMPALAAELVKLNPDVIWVTTTPGIEAVKNATRTIPIVFGASLDPVLSGYVRSLARPGGNLTGISLQVNDIAGKQLELLRLMVPKLARVAALVSPGQIHAAFLNNLETAANTLGVRVLRQEAGTLPEVESGIAAMRREGAQAMIVATGPVFQSNRKAIADLALKARLPNLFPYIDAVRDGGLICFGTNIGDAFRHSAKYVDRILKGAKPADLPVEQPTKFDLVINARTAKALGLRIPHDLLQRADEVIE